MYLQCISSRKLDLSSYKSAVHRALKLAKQVSLINFCSKMTIVIARFARCNVRIFCDFQALMLVVVAFFCLWGHKINVIVESSSALL